MPIYDYMCGACKETTEVRQKLSDKELINCPKCGKKKLIKLISPVGFRLKGDGFYKPSEVQDD